MALRKEPAGRGGQRPGRGRAALTRTRPSGATHGLCSSSQRGAGGHGDEAGVVGAEGEVPAVGGGRVGAKQPSRPLSGTSQWWAMSWQVAAMVPSGRRQSSVRLLVQVPGRQDSGVTPPPLRCSPCPPPCWAAVAQAPQHPLTALALGVVAETAVGQLDVEDLPVEGDAHTSRGDVDGHRGRARHRHTHAVLAEARAHLRLVEQDLGTC